ncbi:serine/threonine-protein phosphatase 7 long form homolog isoform X1 [Coffea arabica]|uniref:Serine/threonine-protein phosphatase n=2 Tax=Coffea arabica TaxID=13443 RepID=A0ABM4X4I2_COFAR|nr:serine/threonine-protein phosphatase 7 long form homolog isoform X1 [Coffea arabica]XP_027118000.1 serine/threonine-protein phosphatase 7 long form homolog isoform X1 [Coffea arabica]
MEEHEQTHGNLPELALGLASSEGPVLSLQAEHRSSDIEKGKDLAPLTCRRADRQFWKMKPLDARVLLHLAQAGFYGVYCIGQLPLDHSLITALVERWREETHTFHFPVGECTITLQDVAILLGLPIDGDPITSPESSKKMQEWQALCQELLGVTPPPKDFNGNRLRLRCLNERFKSLPSDADDTVILCHARAHILRMIGGLLFPDKSQSKVKLMYLPFLRDLEACGKLSWGSAVLACLYREMCRASKSKAKEIGGPLILLQLWAWERLLPFRLEKKLPRLKPPYTEDESNGSDLVAVEDVEALVISERDHDLPGKPLGSRWKERFRHKKGVAHNLELYRNQLDRLKEGEFIWRPYTPEVTAQLPSYCLSGQAIWHTVSPLICFSIVEWHLPNRVMRQFGLKQMKPPNCDTRRDLHRTDMRGREGYDFEKLHLHHVLLWRDCNQHIIQGEPFDGIMADDDPYLVWYREITRLRIGNPSQKQEERYVEKEDIIKSIAETIVSIYKKSDGTIKEFNEDLGLQSLVQIRRMCINSLETMQKHPGPAGHLASEIVVSRSTPAPSSSHMPSRKRHRGLVAPRSPRKSRKKNVNKASPITPTDITLHPLPDAASISVHSPLSVLATSAVGLSQDPPAMPVDPPSPSMRIYSPSPSMPIDPPSPSVPIDPPGPSVPIDPPSLSVPNDPPCPSISIDPPSPPVPNDPRPPPVLCLSKNKSSLPVVFGELSSSVLPLPHSCPPLPLSWPSSGLLTREWIMDLEIALDWSSRNMPPEQFSSVVPEEVFNQLVLSASTIMSKEPNCLRIDGELGLSPGSRVVVVGDLHGQLHDLLFLLRDAKYPDDDRFFIFNGNYVDIGAWGLETFLILLAWKVLFPNKVHLLRGNHETKLCSSKHGFKQEILVKYGTKGKDVYQKCLSCFIKLPLSSVIAGKTYVTHGGLFRSITKGKKSKTSVDDLKEIGSLEDLSKIRRFVLDPPLNGKNAIIGDILWSAPSMSPGFSRTNQQSFGLLWGPDFTDEFLKNSNLKLIIRGHEGPDVRKGQLGLGGIDEGYTIDHDVEAGRLITVFSAPDYPQFQQAKEARYLNKGAYVVLDHPDFDAPSVRIFEAVTPRPKANAYYDYKNVAGSSEEGNLASSSHEDLDLAGGSDEEINCPH